MSVQECTKEPEWFFFARPTHQQNETNNEIHWLAIAKFGIVHRIGLQDVSESFLADAPRMLHRKEVVRGKSAVQIFVNRVDPFAIFALLKLILVQTFTFSKTATGHKTPG